MSDELVLEVGMIGYSELVTPTWIMVEDGVYTTTVDTTGWMSIKALNEGPTMESTVEWWQVDSWWFVRQGDALPTFSIFLPAVFGGN